jgi:predicted lipid-binding transport protein (Tim44 family)
VLTARHARAAALAGALLIGSALALAAGPAGAATWRHAAATLGGLAVITGILVVREWPVALTGSLGAAGTLLAAAFWLWRARFRTEWFPTTPIAPAPSPAPVARRGAAGMASLSSPPQPRPDDPAAILHAARRCFVELQAAWDLADIEGLRCRTTPDMLDELIAELPARGPGPNRTDVVTLQAELLGVERIGKRYVASVAFSGMIRESADAGAAPFKEVWMLTAEDEAGSDWRLARHQALM